jgi:hypothetical protein
MDSTQLSIILSAFAISLTIFNLWLSQIRKGRVSMTSPSIMFLGPDGFDGKVKKVAFYSLLYCTGNRRYIESLYAILSHDGIETRFDEWIVAADGKKAARGGGLFLNQSGHAGFHHILQRVTSAPFTFTPGDYRASIFVVIAGEKNPVLLGKYNLPMTQKECDAIVKHNAGVYYSFDPVTRIYEGRLSSPPYNELVVFDPENQKPLIY